MWTVASGASLTENVRRVGPIQATSHEDLFGDVKILCKSVKLSIVTSAHFILRSPPPFGLTSTVAAYPLSLTKGGFNQLPNFAVNVFSENFPLTIDNLRLITLCERNLKFAQPSKIACLHVSKVTASKLLVNKIMTPQTTRI